jgi:predicted  nucleic acid-binding Zn-ribbon protein
MSKAAKQSLLILTVLLVASVGFAGYTLLQKQELEKAKQQVDKELLASQDREKKSLLKIKQLEDESVQIKDEKDKIEKKVKKAEQLSEELQAKVGELTDSRNELQRRVETIQRERDELVVKLQERPEPQPEEEKPAPPNFAQPAAPAAPVPSQMAPAGDEEYWASVLRQRAELEVLLANMKDDLAKNAVEIVNLKQTNANLQIELDGLKQDKESVDREIQSKEELVHNLSLELARAKNDRKFVSDHVDKLSKENTQLRDQLKQLNTTKGALEKSYVRLQEDKSNIERKLNEAETMVQTNIDEIWDIKENVDKSFEGAKSASAPGKDIELPPIVVTSQGQNEAVETMKSKPGFNGKVVSINEENNFIIVDIGQQEGVRLGDALSVYRDAQYLARLEVIQVRSDISAADIKEQWSKIKVGDVVR